MTRHKTLAQFNDHNFREVVGKVGNLEQLVSKFDVSEPNQRALLGETLREDPKFYIGQTSDVVVNDFRSGKEIISGKLDQYSKELNDYFEKYSTKIISKFDKLKKEELIKLLFNLIPENFKAKSDEELDTLSKTVNEQRKLRSLQDYPSLLGYVDGKMENVSDWRKVAYQYGRFSEIYVKQIFNSYMAENNFQLAKSIGNLTKKKILGFLEGIYKDSEGDAKKQIAKNLSYLALQ